MAKIRLTDVGWSMIPEGHYIFKVTEATYNETFGKIEVDLTAKNGQKHKERYTLINNAGKLNEGAQKAFSYFAKTALNNWDVEEIDVEDLVGCYVEANVAHVESETINEETGKPYVNVRLNDLAPALGFDESEEAEEAVEEETDEDIDLDDFLDA